MSECSALFRFTDESGDHRPHSIEEFGEEGQEDDDNDEEEEEEDQDEEREKEVMEIDTLLNMDESPPKRRRIKQESETESD